MRLKSNVPFYATRLTMFALLSVLHLPVCLAVELEIAEWAVPWADSRPRDPAVTSDGTVWFAGQKGDYIASFDPATEAFERVDLPPGTGPHNVVVDRADRVWIAGNRQGWIGTYEPSSGRLDQIPLPQPAARDPHTLVFAPDGTLWFTAQHGNHVGRLSLPGGEPELFRIPTPSARPYGIVVDPHGRPWIAEFGTARLATIDPASGAVREIELPRSDARPRRLVLTSNGDVWYVDYLDGRLGRYRPADGSIAEWLVPGGDEAGPYGMAVDAADRIWFVETGSSPNRLVAFDSTSLSVVASRELDSGAVRHMVYASRDDAVWFGTDANTLVRARLAP